jgi:hypothetical protein
MPRGGVGRPGSLTGFLGSDRITFEDLYPTESQHTVGAGANQLTLFGKATFGESTGDWVAARLRFTNGSSLGFTAESLSNQRKQELQTVRNAIAAGTATQAQIDTAKANLKSEIDALMASWEPPTEMIVYGLRPLRWELASG